MKLSSLIKEQMDIGDILYSKRDQIELDYGLQVLIINTLSIQ